MLRLRVRLGELHREAEVEVLEPHQRPTDPDPRVTVHKLGLDDGNLVVTVSGPGSVHLLAEDGRKIGSADARRPRIPLREEFFGRERWLPTGPYRLVTSDGPATVTDELVARLPLEQIGVRHRLRGTLGPAGGLLLHLGAPLADHERGRYAQAQLVASYREDPAPVERSLLYFESYAGRTATDSPRAIHEELTGRRPDLKTYWGVLDHAQEVPAGATPVILRSREWYRLLSRAGALVVNTDMEPWFRRRPGQVLLQTFHGYPSKGMGLGQWHAAELPPSRIAENLARGVDTWSIILTPAPEMTRHYREQYGYTGPAVEQGYPRNDALVNPDPEVRRRVRALLGLRDDQTAVLYAPTWRENLAVRPRRAEMTELLDVVAAARALGDSHLILVRGHRFHRPARTSPGVVDVTEYPEVNDLLLATDAVVLDYSSLRFDAALTGSPLVFLVPDLEDYAGGTRSFLFPFEESAPGPFVRDTAEVVEKVRDVRLLRDQWASEIARFNHTYQKWQDGRSAERAVDALLQMMDQA
jgi:CDP-glycerol glycerophosphotransferase (TagB/SpsB family)